MRVKLGRRRPVKLQPYTGAIRCGCRLLNGDLVVPCVPHEHLTAFPGEGGRHRA